MLDLSRFSRSRMGRFSQIRLSGQNGLLFGKGKVRGLILSLSLLSWVRIIFVMGYGTFHFE
jgi:hypothetical protein